MRHEPHLQRTAKRSLLTRRRFQIAGALVVGAILPYVVRATIEGLPFDPPGVNALVGNAFAILLAAWMRLSIETYPGIRSSYVIFPAALTAHGVVVAFFLLSRLPYDRTALVVGLMLHVIWNYLIYVFAEHRVRPRIAIVPFGGALALQEIANVDWLVLQRARIEDTGTCNAIVADFAVELPAEWEAFLADAALAGRIVYQVKQLSESLTGQVEISHLSENSFGSLLPARGYFHLKGLLDFLVAAALLPVALPVMALCAVAIRAEGTGPALFRQARVGHAGRIITLFKFRTMHAATDGDERAAAMTSRGDKRITRVGAVLRRFRLDELPQIFNILRWEMSWIGPRPEAQVLSLWYTSELPFYRYRHVVKPGISGWAQVNQGHVSDVDEVHAKLRYDFYYIKYFSPWLDVLIVFRTVKTMLSGYGSR